LSPAADPTTIINVSGTWVLNRSDNLDAYLTVMGFGWLQRKAAAAASLTIVVVQTGIHFEVTTKSLLGEKTFSYDADGTPYNPPAADGGVWHATTVITDNIICDRVETQTGVMHVKRFLSPDGQQYIHESILTPTAGGEAVTMTRYFDRQA
jgi:hypothetical protein